MQDEEDDSTKIDDGSVAAALRVLRDEADDTKPSLGDSVASAVANASPPVDEDAETQIRSKGPVTAPIDQSPVSVIPTAPETGARATTWVLLAVLLATVAAALWLNQP